MYSEKYMVRKCECATRIENNLIDIYYFMTFCMVYDNKEKKIHFTQHAIHTDLQERYELACSYKMGFAQCLLHNT